MALSRSGRIILLLVLNVIMFLAEIIVGYMTGSLALIADAFHMLSDVLSQIIALYAIRLAAKTKWEATLSYGWQRAELLGALYNGVFLLALCFTILLDAIQRFFKSEVIEDPKLVLIVGGIGLVCNLLGLVLFHDHAGHGHSHGGHSHSHGHKHAHEKKSRSKKPKAAITSPTSSTPSTSPTPDTDESRPPLRYESSLDRISPLRQTSLQNLQLAVSDVQRQMDNEERHQHEESVRNEKAEYNSPDDAVVNMDGAQQHSHRDHDHGENHKHDDHDHDHSHDDHDHDHSHDDKKGEKHQPSGEDLNMRGVFLHVLGDALGSVGVIFTALFIWLTDFSWKQYMDPIISIFISGIIIHSALPLVRSASFVLLQGVPVGVDIEEIRKEIKAIPDVISIHDLHIWQLTNIKMVASLHMLVTNQEAFERVSRTVKTIMHRAGVHSTTIQPEFPSMHPYFSLIIIPEDEIRDDLDCALLCADGEEACDVGSCCTQPVKR
ncbi:MAG: cation efflux protein [Linnemannia gamsii]|nr:MAG: cation efflux protein [Linnemannia gamsii]